MMIYEKTIYIFYGDEAEWEGKGGGAYVASI